MKDYIAKVVSTIRHGKYYLFPTSFAFYMLFALVPAFTSLELMLTLLDVDDSVLFRYIYQAKEGISSYVRRFLELDIVNKANVSLSRASYGVYLLHTTLLRLVKVMVSGLELTGTQICLMIIFLTIGLTTVTWAIVLLLNKIPLINKVTGYH